MPVLAYVASLDVNVIDTSTNKVINTIVTDAYPNSIAITPNGNFAFVTNDVANDVTVIDTRSNTVIKNIRVGEYPEGIAITPNGRFAYIANTFSDTVSVLNTITLIVVATIPVGHFPEGVAVSPNGNFVYVTNTMSNTVSVIDTSTNTVAETIPVGPYPVSIATSSNNFIYVGIQGSNATNRNITVIDFYTNKVVDIIPLDGVPTSLAIRPDNKYIYATIGDLDTVDIIFTGSDRVVASVEVGDLPWGIAITPDGRFAYVANLGSNNVSVIDTSTNTVVDIISVFEPVNVAIANIPPSPSPSDSICIETTRIFDSCTFEEQQRKTFILPAAIEDKDIQCEVIETKSSILEITKINEQQDIVNVKLRIKVVLGFISKCSNNLAFRRVVHFDKNITLIAPQGTDIFCNIDNATCECLQTSNLSCNTRFLDKICCTVKVTAIVKSKKLVQIEVPYLGSCSPRP